MYLSLRMVHGDAFFMNQQPYEFGPQEHRREVLGRLLYLSFARFMKATVNLLISLVGLVKQFVRDAVRMFVGR